MIETISEQFIKISPDSLFCMQPDFKSTKVVASRYLNTRCNWCFHGKDLKVRLEACWEA